MAKIILKAASEAPELVAVGNFVTELNDGYYEVEDPKFASFIVDSGFARIVKSKTAQKAENLGGDN